MKIIIPGGTGQIGTALAGLLYAEGHEVIVLSRNPASTPWRTMRWEGQSLGPWATEFEGADAVINLAGRSVNCRYSPANREAIKQSRVATTRLVGQAIASSKKPARVWLNASTATLYTHRYDAPNDEATGIHGSRDTASPDTWKFSIDVADSWERAAEECDLPDTRLVKLRMAMTMGAGRGGVFDTFRSLARKGLGGTLGDGRQFVSWIHEEDCLRAMLWLIEHEGLEGAVNLCSPNPLPNKEFMRELRKACGVPFGLPAARWMLEIGTFFMRTETELVLKSRRVVPRRLLDSGFCFKFPDWPTAARHLAGERER
jgi:uncharacterized protein (TIGR01777 family)